MRPIKFRAWDKHEKRMRDWNDLIQTDAFWNGCDSDKDDILMQFTGLNDNSNSLNEIYEGDIIDAEGKLKGNIYESPQIYQEGTDYIIEGMGTKTWRSTESVAMGRGCNYAK